MLCLLSVLLINVVSAYEWQSIPSPGIRIHTHVAVYDPINDLFFITGGDSSGYETNMDICLAFDPKTNTWETKEPMPVKRGRHQAAYRNSLISDSSNKDRCEEESGYIHVLCGKDDYGNHINTHEVYNIERDYWVTAAPAPLAVARPSSVTWRNSLIYLIGGYDATHTARKEVNYYNPETDSWHPATSLPRRLHGGGTDIKGDSIFIIGGADGSLRYTNILIGEINPTDPSVINWSWGEPLPISENSSNMLAIKDNKAYMIGGIYNDGTNEVWEYDIQSQTWISLPDYPTPFISRGDFAERRDCSDSLGIVYSFMGDTSNYWSRKPTDKCYKLVKAVVKNDAGMYAINSPVSDTTTGALVQVNGTVKNYGEGIYSFESGVNIYDPDSIIVFTDIFQLENVAPLDTVNIYFGSFRLEKSGTYTVEMFTYASDDVNSSNDSLITTFNSYYKEEDDSLYSWQELPSPGIRNHDHSVVYDPINDLFFLTGGDSTGNYTNMDICLAFDPKTNTWDTKQPMPTKRARHRAAYRNGFIHVLCGKDNYGNYITTHEVYDIELNTWSTKASAPLAVARSSVVTWRDSLVYLMGGYDATHTARTEVYYYDQANNSWDSVTSLPRRLHGGGTEIKGDTIFIIGGCDGASCFSRILIGKINPCDPTDINWSWENSLPISNNGNNMLAIKDNKAYMIGGLYNEGTNEVWEYDIQNQNWTSLPDYPTSFLSRGDFAERRDGPDSSGVVYCFMGDISDTWSRVPTDECYKLVRLNSPRSEDNAKNKGKILEKNSIEINNIIVSTNEINIRYNLSEGPDLRIRIYDVSGREILSQLVKNIPSEQYKIPIDKNLKNGIYFIKIETGTTVAFEKFILFR